MTKLTDLPPEIHLAIAGHLLDNYRRCEDLDILLFRYQPGCYEWSYRDLLALSEVSDDFHDIVVKAVKQAQKTLDADLQKLKPSIETLPDGEIAGIGGIPGLILVLFLPFKRYDEAGASWWTAHKYHEILLIMIAKIRYDLVKVEYHFW